MGEVVQIRDYKTKEERRQERRSRIMDEIIADSAQYLDLPKVQPNYTAPEKDPA